MLKWLTMVGSTILIAAVILVVRYDEIHRTEGKGYDIKCTQSSEPSATMNSLVCTAEHSQKTKSSESDSTWWHVFFTWPEGITALAVIATLAVFCIQAILMRVHAKELKQLAKAAADNAEAAKLSAQAVVNAERAWLVIGFVKTNNTKSGALSEFAFTCRNPGKTPATVKRIDMGYSVVQDPLDLPVPMRKEDLRSIELPGKTFIVSTDSFPIKAKVNPEEILYDKGRIYDFATGDESVVFYGRIVYYDVFDSQKPRETRWCYSHDRTKDTLVRIGPEEYNSHT